jgi:hypothetical protein
VVALHEDFQDVQHLPKGLWVDCLGEGFVGQNPFG